MNISINQRLLTLVLAVFITGCSSTKVWKKPEASTSDLRKDSYQCEKDARQSDFGPGIVGGSLRQEFYDRCMESHGWTLKDDSETY